MLRILSLSVIVDPSSGAESLTVPRPIFILWDLILFKGNPMDFHYQKLLPLGPDTTTYRLLTRDHVSTSNVNGQTMLKVEREGLELLAREALRDVSFYLRTALWSHMG